MLHDKVVIDSNMKCTRAIYCTAEVAKSGQLKEGGSGIAKRYGVTSVTAGMMGYTGMQVSRFVFPEIFFMVNPRAVHRDGGRCLHTMIIVKIAPSPRFSIYDAYGGSLLVPS